MTAVHKNRTDQPKLNLTLPPRRNEERTIDPMTWLTPFVLLHIESQVVIQAARTRNEEEA